jgi:hypothetical protein
MNQQTLSKFSLALGLALVLGVTVPLSADQVTSGAPAEQFTGNLVNLNRGVRHSQPFVLTIDRYATAHDLDRFTAILNSDGPLKLRDVLWQKHAGTLSIGGGLGYEVSFAQQQDTPEGKLVRVFLNRALSTRELAFNTRSSHYPFTVIELHVDSSGNGHGDFIRAAHLSYSDGTLEVKSLGTIATRLVGVRAS